MKLITYYVQSSVNPVTDLLSFLTPVLINSRGGEIVVECAYLSFGPLIDSLHFMAKFEFYSRVK